MAKKKKIKTDNMKPRAAVNMEKTISTVNPNPPNPNNNPPITISGIIKNVYNEVGVPAYSTLYGTDSNGIPLRAITNAQEDPLMMRYEYPTVYGSNDFDVSAGDEVYGDNILNRDYYFQQDTKSINNGKIVIRRFEKKGKPYITYDEEYFNHIFNWPTSHTLRSRKLGGFIKEIITTTITTPGAPGATPTAPVPPTISSSSVTNIYPVAATLNGQFNLQKVQSSLYYINDDWTYTEIPLNADGTVNSETVTDRIGKPVLYHGGTDNNSIFFNYVVDTTNINEVATSNLVAIGDTVNGATITNIVNYLVDTALKRTASRYPKKGEVNIDITQTQFLALDSSYTVADFNNTKAWLKLNEVDGITKGNTISGKGIQSNTYVTGVDESRNKIYISKTLSDKKVKLIRVFDDAINKVNKSTLCYAEISGTSVNFSADTDYSVTRNNASTGITIRVRAGKGVKNRSAITGVYFSKNKKELEYVPIFYSADSNCQKNTLTDNNGTYTLGTVIWNDNTRLENKYLMTNPSAGIAYSISSFYLSFTNAPIDKETLERMIDSYNQNTSVLDLYNKINEYVKTVIGSRRAAGVFDDICRDEIFVEYFQAYNPLIEVNTFTSNIGQINSAVGDDCVTKLPAFESYSIDESKQKIESIINNSVQNSIILPDEYYKKLVSNKDSLMNRLTDASKLVQDSTPKQTKINNLPPSIEGEDSSGVRWLTENFRDLPPAMDRVKFFVNDISLASDKDLDPTLNLDPATTVNQPKIIIRSRPCWTWGGENSIPVGINGYTPFIATIGLNVDVDSNNHVNSITTFPGSINKQTETIISGNQTITISRSWIEPTPKTANDNIIFGEKKKTYQQGGYIKATNWTLPPELRDLDHKERTEDSDIENPTVSIYPKQVWMPNINYQIDYHKMFSFRTEELSELLGETITSFGNPYLDNPVRAKLTKTLEPGDTTIHVKSTAGFVSSGYLIIPKYIKKLYTNETGNINKNFTYCGEEIIYYKSKTDTSFNTCERQLFGTTDNFNITVPSYSLEANVMYKIVTLGDTNWQSVGAGKSPSVGTIFTASGSITGTGLAEVLGSTTEEVPEVKLVSGVKSPSKIPIMTSYEYGFSISQHWVFTLKGN